MEAPPPPPPPQQPPKKKPPQSTQPETAEDGQTLFDDELDRLLPVGKELIFDAIPANDKSAYIVVPGGHKVTPIKAKSQVADWLNTL